MPAQPGKLDFRSAQEVRVDNKRAPVVAFSVYGPAQPGLETGETTPKGGVAMQSHCPPYAPAPDGRCIVAHSRPSMPAKPGARNKPKLHRHSNVQVAMRGFLASDTHNTR
eukprot:2458024-Amphidinium_carterae.1